MELWDVYDKDRRKTGRFHERGTPLCDGEYHLVIHIWVRNAEGKFLITKRDAEKEPFPGLWECTGGSALAGETSEEAALRETREETGLDHRKSARRVVLSYMLYDWHGDVWLFETDDTPRQICLQTGETVDAMWADKETILAMWRDGRFCPYDYVGRLLESL